MACRFLYLQENRARNSRQAVADHTLSMSNTELIKEFQVNCEEIEKKLLAGQKRNAASWS